MQATTYYMRPRYDGNRLYIEKYGDNTENIISNSL